MLEQLAKQELAAAAKITADARQTTPPPTTEPLAKPAAPAIDDTALENLLPEA